MDQTMPKTESAGKTQIQMPKIPWQDRPAGCVDPMWRYEANPIIPRDALPTSHGVFNSAAVAFGNGFAGVFRADDKTRRQHLHVGFSKDGLSWDINPEPIRMVSDDPDLPPHEMGYDPRVCWIEDRYYVIWCDLYEKCPTIGLAWTRDFRRFHQMERAFLPFNRNGVLFPRRINGMYVMLSRPSDGGHTAFGDIYCSRSPDLRYWGDHRLVMKPQQPWETTKIGAGPVPIETPEGWLLLHHGVLCSCNGFVYSFGAALLDLDEPWKVVARAKPYLMTPARSYEHVGDVPNVVFPVAALVEPHTDRMAVYYGAADTVVCLAFAHVSELVDWVKANA